MTDVKQEYAKQDTHGQFYGESLWRLSCDDGTVELVVRAYTAGQARRKLKAVIRQARAGTASFTEAVGPYAGSLRDFLCPKEQVTIRGPNFDGTGIAMYTNVDHMVDVAFLKREHLKDVFFISHLDG